MSENQLEAFLAVVQHGTCRKAAEQLFVSQPTISYRLQTLEKALGVQLFEHTNFQLSLTAAGNAFIPEAQRIYSSMKSARERMRLCADAADKAATESSVAPSATVCLTINPQEAQLLQDLLSKLTRTESKVDA